MAYTKEVGIKDFYNYYIEQCDKHKFKKSDYKTYTNVIKDCNILIRDKIISNETFKIPYRNGVLSIVKFANKFHPDKQWKWKVDYVKTKELGYVVYWGSEFGYRWRWDKLGAITSGIRYYHFKPVRKCSRMIAEAIRNNIQYYDNRAPIKQKTNDK